MGQIQPAAPFGAPRSANSNRQILIMRTLRRLCVASLVALTLSSPAARAASAIPDHYKALYFDAARAGRTDLLGGMIDDGASVDERDSHGYTALIIAAYDGQPQTVEYLMGRGADPCAADLKGNTALMGVAFKGQLTIAERLVTRCDVNTRNREGQTAVMMAALFGHADIVRLLATHGANLALTDASGNSAGSVAHQQGNAGMEALLAQLQAGAPASRPRP
jgi:ankyrin repeat protein